MSISKDFCKTIFSLCSSIEYALNSEKLLNLIMPLLDVPNFGFKKIGKSFLSNFLKSIPDIQLLRFESK